MNEPCSDIEAEPTVVAIAQALAEAEDAPDLPVGPVTGTVPDVLPIGHAGGAYYFISKDGERRQLTAREMVRLNLSSLFGGDTKWMCDNFPCYNKQSDVIDGAFNANHAAEWMMRECSRAGLFNVDTPSRRHGVWRSRTQIVAHLGGSIWYRGQKQRAGCIVDGAIYPACTTLEEPDFAHPADRFDAQRIRANLNAWSFTQEHDADLLFGFIGASLLGSFPQWRVHALITGEGGSGKSTLARFIGDLIGAQATKMDDYSEAGVRQKLADEARLVILEESENEDEVQAQRMSKIFSLLRKMSDGVGARITRGSSGGVAINTTVTGTVLIIGINPPPLKPQDRSRILVVPINKPSSGTSSEDIKAFRREATILSPRLRARALIGAQRFEETFQLYRVALREGGCDDRRSDFFGTMLAGRSLLLDDDIPSVERVRSYVATLGARLHLIMIDDSETSDGQSCLHRLMDAECAAIRDGLKKSIGQVVANAMDTTSRPENEKLLPLGLRMVDIAGSGGHERMLFVANDALGLKRIFHNTPWADGNWRTSLNRLPEVKPSPKPISVGRKCRGLLIPKSLLPTPSDDHDNEIEPHDHPDPIPRP